MAFSFSVEIKANQKVSNFYFGEFFINLNGDQKQNAVTSIKSCNNDSIQLI